MKMIIEVNNDESLFNALDVFQKVIITVQNEGFKKPTNMIVTKRETVYKLNEGNSTFELEEYTEVIEEFKE